MKDTEMNNQDKRNSTLIYDAILQEIVGGRDMKHEMEYFLNPASEWEPEQMAYFISEIIKIENSLEYLPVSRRMTALRNCVRCIYWIPGAETEYRYQLTKQDVEKKAESPQSPSVFVSKTYHNETVCAEKEKSVIKDQKLNRRDTKGAVEHYNPESKSDWSYMATAGNVTTANIYSDQVVFTSSKGHGYAAEQANHLYDTVMGKDAKIIGSDLKKNGADRLVNGVNIQTKYCASGSKCIAECFEQGTFRYTNNDGSPMMIEVPSDCYEDAIKAMEKRIQKGEVPGINDVSKAKDIVKKGRFTYLQAENIAKFGKIESLTYDAINGIQVMGQVFGMTSIITFACSVWNGEDVKSAACNALEAGTKVGGLSWASSVITAQLGRTSMERGLRPFTDAIVKSMDKNTTALLANGIRQGTVPIQGAAAANYLSKVLRGNVITATVSTAVMSMSDINRLVKGEISGNQAFKNIATVASSVAGGTAGGMGGAAIGAAVGSVIPGVGTVIGGMVGGVLGGFSGGSITSKAVKDGLDQLIEDDSKKMMDILSKQLEKVAFDYLLNEKEIHQVIEIITKNDMPKMLRTMYSCDIREKYAYDMVKKIAIDVISRKRSTITM